MDALLPLCCGAFVALSMHPDPDYPLSNRHPYPQDYDFSSSFCLTHQILYTYSSYTALPTEHDSFQAAGAETEATAAITTKLNTVDTNPFNMV